MFFLNLFQFFRLKFKFGSKFSDVDKVHDIMDDIAEQQQIAGEISNAISNPVGFDSNIDEVNSSTKKKFQIKSLIFKLKG